MNWLQALYETYENCSDRVGNLDDPTPLVPVAHIPQKTQIEISITADGKFINASVSPMVVPIPCTEKSTGRTANVAAHPLSDKLQYVAADFYTMTGEKPKKNKDYHQNYLQLLERWAQSQYSHPFVNAIETYLKSIRCCVMKSLCDVGVFPVGADGFIPSKWNGDKNDTPEIYKVTNASNKPWDAFVRWRIASPDMLEDRAFSEPDLWKSWERFENEQTNNEGFCFLTGKFTRLAEQHPRFIRYPGDGAKIISSNDSTGYTFRGRFTDNSGNQVCGLSFVASQKAHSALRWLIAKQGRRDGNQAIVSWSTRDKALPDIWSASDKFFGGESVEQTVLHVETGQEFAEKLKKVIGGYRADIGNEENVCILALDSATSGRICITYFRHLGLGEFLDRLNRWHFQAAWPQNFGKDRKFIGAPAPKDIAQCAHGCRRFREGSTQVEIELDPKQLAATYLRLLPCIVDGMPVPQDLVNSCRRSAIVWIATSKKGGGTWECEKALGIACALFRKSQIEQQGVDHGMSLDRTRKSRSYLYGRLLAYADVLEQATHGKGENRPTNASRLMQRFADRPLSTWRTIELQLTPYEHRLLRDKPWLLAWLKQDLEETMELFAAEDFENDTPLTGEFLLGYHNQRTAMRNKRNDETNQDTIHEKEEL
ncbi:MAG: type I-C CRISPR-associated protein Cas8c/Csd1 [Verrucomicrobia bacterium]|nr:type I-C CRISPR-associated protein Cas8c/Csd1 [Verrucomicrobiota bacterium]MCH8513504.1 type I-C CRISPR-associated protein Cas8c/Csd1 [Kiritimatiellia bacterium]